MKLFRRSLPILLLSATLTPSFLRAAWADSNSGEAKFASGTGNFVYLGAGLIAPLLEDGKDGEQHSMRTFDSVLTSTIITEVLKNVTHEKRPDGSNFKSFPSGHATAAFAVATMESEYHPKQSLFWYAGATTIAVSRVQLNKHHWHDVAAGAAVGYFTSKFELHHKHGLILQPFIHDQGKEHVAGLQFSHSF
jgi:hypothetical protein